MKSLFEEPTLEIVLFTMQDVIATSEDKEEYEIPTIDSGVAN